MAIDKTELEAHLDKVGVGKRSKKKILDGLDPSTTKPARTSAGHGPAAPDDTLVPSM